MKRIINVAAAAALVPLLGLVACAKDDKQTDSPEELDLPPETKVADERGGEAESVEDEKVAAKKVETPADKPKIVHPQDRDPDKEKAKMARSRKHSAEAKKLLRSNQGDKAIEKARAALREHEQNVEAMLVIAEAFYKQGKHELVQSVTGSILKVDDKVLSPEEKSQAYNLMGFAYLQAGRRSDAFTAFKNAAETDEHNASAWNNLGVQYMWRGDPQTAESCFAYAVSLDPKFADAHLNHGAALRANGKLGEAEQALQSAAKLRPDWAEVHFNLGVLYLDATSIPKLDEIAKLDAAIKEFESYKQLVAKGKTSIERSKKKRGPTDAMGNELVTPTQADLYIKAARKGIESEERRIEREKRREQRKAEKQAEAEPPAASEEGEGDGAGDAEPEPKQPQQPQQPGGEGDDGAKDPPAAKPQEPKKPQKPQPPADKPKPQKPKVQKPG